MAISRRLPRRRAHRWVRDAGDAPGQEGGHFFQGCGQAFRAHRFHQVIQRGGVERRQRMLVVGRAEHYRRRRLALAQQPRGFQAVDAGHGDIQQHQVRVQLFALLQHLLAVFGLANHLDLQMLAQQHAQALARQWLVIGDQHPHLRGRHGHPPC